MKNYIKYYLLIIVMGFFSIVAQTLIFRRFLVSFEGNELSVGLFFFSWLVWICIGAVFAKNKIIRKISKYFHWLIIIYIPIFAVQFLGLFFINFIIGGNFYEAVSISKVAVCAILLNAPVSFITGFIFVAASDWINNCTDKTVPVITVYMMEAFGSFIGALFVTLLLFVSCCEVLIFFLTSIVLLFTVAYFSFSSRLKISRLIAPLLLLIFLLAAFSPLPGYIQNLEYRKQWNHLIKDGEFIGAFSTPQSEYVYGKYNRELVILASNSIYDSYPNLDSAGTEAIEYLSQNPRAQKILVVGTGGYSLSSVLADLPQIKEIYWLDTDPGYSEEMKSIFFKYNKGKTSKLKTVSKDIRNYIKTVKLKFDLIILHFPAPSNLLQNRYFTKEFFEKLRKLIKGSGVIAISFPGGDNYLGPELTFLGSSIYITLKSVFPDIALKPGSSSIFFVAKSKGILSESGELMESRLSKIKGMKNIYVPGQIRSSYEKNRIDFQLSSYDKLIKSTPVEYLVNSDKNPKSFLYTLLFTIKKYSGIHLDFNQIKSLLYIVFPLCIFLLILYFIFRIIYCRLFKSELLSIKRYSKTRQKQYINKYSIGVCRHEVYLLVFAAAVIGMGLSLILLFLFQINYGTLFLCFGLITAFFMLGMCVNAWLIDKILQSCRSESILILFSFFFILFNGLILLKPPLDSLVYFGVLFFFTGFFCGTYFPLAGYLLKTGKQQKDYQTASILEIVDNLGGAVSSIIFSIILIPVVGLSNSLILFIVLLLVINIHAFFLKEKNSGISVKKEQYADKLDMCFKFIGILLLVFLVIYIFLSAFTYKTTLNSIENEPVTFSKGAVNELIGGAAKCKQGNVILNGVKIYYLEVHENNKTIGYIFRTKDFTDYDRGYAGPINMLSYVDTEGKIRNFTVLNSNETPAYLNSVLRQKKIYLGENSFGAYEDYGINAVTGATITSKAIAETLYLAGNNFNNLRSGDKVQPEESISAIKDRNLLAYILGSCLVIIALVLSFIKKKRYRKWLRRFFLLVIILLFGFYLNIQYSSDQVLALVFGKINLQSFNIFTFLCLGIPVLVVLFGNVYCGYLCPFGALQELIYDVGYFFRKKLHLNKRILKTVWIICRSFKYIILLLIVIVFIYTNSRNIIENSDLLLKFFSFKLSQTLLVFTIVMLVISCLYNRFWCRVLCPSGAFLSVINGLHKFIFGRNKIIPGNCDLGVRGITDLDCILCNRCFSIKSLKKTGKIKSVILLVFSVVLLAVFIFSIAANMESNENINKRQDLVKSKTAVKENKASESLSDRQRKRKHRRKQVKFTKSSVSVKSIGKARKIDLNLYQQYINKNYLSDYEAMYYRKIAD